MYIYLNINFENIIIRFHVLIIFSVFAKFQEHKKINSYVINDMFKF